MSTNLHSFLDQKRTEAIQAGKISLAGKIDSNMWKISGIMLSEDE